MRGLVLALALLALDFWALDLVSSTPIFAEDSPKSTVVGPVEATVRLEPLNPLIGDPVELTLQVKSEVGVEVLMPQFGEALDRFEIRDYRSVPERLDDDGKKVAQQVYVLEPRTSGEHSVPPILVEFVDHRPNRKAAPDDQDAYELLTERLDFEVQSVVPSDAAEELIGVLDELGPLPTPATPKWPYGVGLAVALLIASPFLVRAFLHWRRLARRRSAFEIARSQLERLLGDGIPKEADPLDAFFVRLSSIIRQYIENRFELRAPEFTTEEFLSQVSDSPDVSVEHQKLLRDFLKQADLVKFAHVLPAPEEVERSVEVARRFLDETREAAPLIDEEAPAPVEVSRA